MSLLKFGVRVFYDQRLNQEPPQVVASFKLLVDAHRYARYIWPVGLYTKVEVVRGRKVLISISGDKPADRGITWETT